MKPRVKISETIVIRLLFNESYCLRCKYWTISTIKNTAGNESGNSGAWNILWDIPVVKKALRESSCSGVNGIASLSKMPPTSENPMCIFELYEIVAANSFHAANIREKIIAIERTNLNKDEIGRTLFCATRADFLLKTNVSISIIMNTTKARYNPLSFTKDNTPSPMPRYATLNISCLLLWK